MAEYFAFINNCVLYPLSHISGILLSWTQSVLVISLLAEFYLSVLLALCLIVSNWVYVGVCFVVLLWLCPYRLLFVLLWLCSYSCKGHFVFVCTCPILLCLFMLPYWHNNKRWLLLTLKCSVSKRYIKIDAK